MMPYTTGSLSNWNQTRLTPSHVTYGPTAPSPPFHAYSCLFMPSGTLVDAAMPPYSSSPTGPADFPYDTTLSTVQITHDPPHLDLAQVDDAAPDLSIDDSC